MIYWAFNLLLLSNYDFCKQKKKTTKNASNKKNFALAISTIGIATAIVEF